MYEVFKKLMERRGVTPYKVAQETGVAQSTLSQWKVGRSEPKQATMQKLADYFGVSVKYLMTGEDEPQYYIDPETAEIAQRIQSAKEKKAKESTRTVEDWAISCIEL